MASANVSARPKGRRTAAFVFFAQSCYEEVKQQHSGQSLEYHLRGLAESTLFRWKTMSDEEKKPFHEMAANDLQRFNEEMKTFTPPEQEERNKKKCCRPIRALPAFEWFCKEHSAAVEAQHPEYGTREVTAELGRMWVYDDVENRDKYRVLAYEDGVRFQKEMIAYKKRKEDFVAKERARQKKEMIASKKKTKKNNAK